MESGIIERSVLESTVKSNLDNAVKVGSTLLKAKLLDDTILFAALRLQTLFRLGYLDRDTTLMLLQYCKQEHLILDHTLEQKEIYVPSRMQWTWV